MKTVHFLLIAIAIAFTSACEQKPAQADPLKAVTTEALNKEVIERGLVPSDQLLAVTKATLDKTATPSVIVIGSTHTNVSTRGSQQSNADTGAYNGGYYDDYGYTMSSSNRSSIRETGPEKSEVFSGTNGAIAQERYNEWCARKDKVINIVDRKVFETSSSFSITVFYREIEKMHTPELSDTTPQQVTPEIIEQEHLKVPEKK